MSLQLGTCTRMNARISQAQCEKNRKGVPPGRGKWAYAACLSCEGCPGLVDLEAAEYLPPPELEKPGIAPLFTDEKEKEQIMGKRGTCKHCKREGLTLPVADTCGSCYNRIRKGQNPATGEPETAQDGATPQTAATPPTPPVRPARAKSAPREQPSGSRSLDENPAGLESLLFADDPEMLGQLKAVAQRSRRTLINEILWRLERSLEAA